MRFDVIIPARNEASFIADIVSSVTAWPEVERTFVVDNASEDDTGKIASKAGATVIAEPRIGKGYAVKSGLRGSSADYVFLCDADVRGLTHEKVLAAVKRVETGEADLCRLAMGRAAEYAPVTTLLAVPLLQHLFPELKIEEPLGGIVAIERQRILSLALPNNWGFDVALTLSIAQSRGKLLELPASELSHRQRPIQDYQAMAYEVAEAILSHTDRLDRPLSTP